MLILWFLIAVGFGGEITHAERIRNLRKDGRDVAESAARLGLHASEHSVLTADGYVVHASRVHGLGARTGPPVLLMHGLLQNAAGWLDAGRASLGWLLAAAGRDLWLCAARGSHSSRRHAWLSADTDPLYWRFTAHEIGSQDLPAFIDYILDASGSNKLDYIGHSQGGGSFFIMCSERPEYCDKVNLMIALAPATRLLHTRSVPIRFLADFFEKNEEELNKHGMWELLPRGSFVQTFLKNFCSLSDSVAEACIFIKDVLDGGNPGSITTATSKAVTATSPAGTSVHNVAWYGQLLKSDNFHKFDYGPEQNLVYYGSKKAPVYNFSAVTAPVVVMYGRNDGLVDVKDVKWLVRQLPNVKKVVEIADPLWTHFDFALSKNIPKFLFPDIEEVLC